MFYFEFFKMFGKKSRFLIVVFAIWFGYELSRCPVPDNFENPFKLKALIFVFNMNEKLVIF